MSDRVTENSEEQMRPWFDVQAGHMAPEEGGKDGYLDKYKGDITLAYLPLDLSLAGSETKFANTEVYAHDSLCLKNKTLVN